MYNSNNNTPRRIIMKKYKSLSLLLSAILLCAGCNSAENAADNAETTTAEATVAAEDKLIGEGLDNGEFQYNEYENHIEITKYLSDNSDVIIPDEIGGKPVTELGAKAFEVYGPQNVTIADSVTDIAEQAFFSCYTLKNVVLPDGITKISESTFSYCGLTDITIPDSVTEIENHAFSFCSGLTGIVIPDSVVMMEQYAFIGCDNLKSITYKGAEYQSFDEFYEAFAKENNIVITTEATTAAPVTTTAVTTTTSEAATTTTAPEITTDPESYDYAGFDIAEYYPADEAAQPLVIRYKNEVKPALITEEISLPDGIDKEKSELARQAVEASGYYARAVEQAREIFSFENGTYTLNTDEAPFYADSYEGCLDSTEAYRINPLLLYAESDSFGGNLFTFRIPLPVDFMEWSGHNYYYITVYVNQQNEAMLIPECCSQTLTKLTGIYVGDSVHIIANTGHSTGTSCSTIISLNADGYKVEYTGCYIECSESDANYLLDNVTGGSSDWYNMLCYDKEKGYKCVTAHTLSGEAMEIICSNPAVLEQIPDIRRACEKGYVYVIGGYISDTSDFATFTLENGEPVYFDGIIYPGKSDSVSIIAENY